jgi:polar amino acid transport system permease protein
LIARKIKFRALDFVVLILCIALGVYVYYRIQYGLQYKGNWGVIPGFLIKLDSATGRWVPNFLLEGLITTLKLSVWATLLAILFGVVAGLFRTGSNLFLRMVGRTYVELIRNLPPLVLIYIFYFFVVDQLMRMSGIQLFALNMSDSIAGFVAVFFAERNLLTQFITGVITVAFFEGAYITEIIRAGIESIERGQNEAAYSLGLSWADKMRFVVMPQAVKRVLPPLANEFINTIKYSSITSVVSIQELTYMGRTAVVATRYMFETWITVAVMYLVLTLTLSVFAGYLEKRLRQSD